MSDVALEGREQWLETKGGNRSLVVRSVTERALFQTLASMAIPAFIIHTTVHRVGHVCTRDFLLFPLLFV